MILTNPYPGSKSSSVSCCNIYPTSRYSYGEIGTYILSQLLFKLFPDAVFMDDCTFPLSITDFRWKVLLPEAAAKLIMHDTHADHHTAVRTMRRSGRYGTAVFPYDDKDVYDEMILEVLFSCDSNSPGDLSPSAPNSLSERASMLIGEAVASLSDDDQIEAMPPAQSADASPSITALATPSDAGNDVANPQKEQNETGSDIAISFDRGPRRRKLPRSMIPIILTEFQGGDRGDDHVLKKLRLA